jgi:hypothetical protein
MTVATIVYIPVVLFALKAADVATPLASVIAVVVFVLVFTNVPLAPAAGAVKVTVIPETLFPFSSTTKAFKLTEFVLPLTIFWGVPA